MRPPQTAKMRRDAGVAPCAFPEDADAAPNLLL